MSPGSMLRLGRRTSTLALPAFLLAGLAASEPAHGGVIPYFTQAWADYTVYSPRSVHIVRQELSTVVADNSLAGRSRLTLCAGYLRVDFGESREGGTMVLDLEVLKADLRRWQASVTVADLRPYVSFSECRPIEGLPLERGDELTWTFRFQGMPLVDEGFVQIRGGVAAQ